ncbi:MAG: hypothetical protein EAZ99_01340 [Alphaproteobacteria bacterium]|nr:MAG: hypothetical protein EAZ99_01340 [Alphaproteobacteria bacterium]
MSDTIIKALASAESWNAFMAQALKTLKNKDFIGIRQEFLPSTNNFSGYVFKRCLFQNITFNASSFEKAEFQLCRFERLKFKGCNLTSSKMSYCQLGDVTFENCRAIGFDMSYSRFSVLSARLCDFRDGNFTKIAGSGLDFGESCLVFANFEEANIPGTNFSKADLRGATLRKAKLERSGLDSAKIWNIDSRDWDIKDIRLTGCYVGRDGKDFEAFSAASLDVRLNSRSEISLNKEGKADALSSLAVEAVIELLNKTKPQYQFSLKGVDVQQASTTYTIKIDHAPSDRPTSADNSSTAGASTVKSEAVNASTAAPSSSSTAATDSSTPETAEIPIAQFEDMSSTAKTLFEKLNDAIKGKKDLQTQLNFMIDQVRAYCEQQNQNLGKQRGVVVAFDIVSWSKMNLQRRREISQKFMQLLAKILRKTVGTAIADCIPPSTAGDSFVQIFPETLDHSNSLPETSNHANRHMECALDFAFNGMQTLKSAGINARCGVARGEILLQPDEEQNQLIPLKYQGDAFVSACRLQSSARPDEVVVTRQIKNEAEHFEKYTFSKIQITAKKSFNETVDGVTKKIEEGAPILCYKLDGTYPHLA